MVLPDLCLAKRWRLAGTLCWAVPPSLHISSIPMLGLPDLSLANRWRLGVRTVYALLRVHWFPMYGRGDAAPHT